MIWTYLQFHHVRFNCSILPWNMLINNSIVQASTNYSFAYCFMKLWWLSLGIFLPTIFKAPFQLNCHGLVIWIHCKYELFNISPYVDHSEFILIDSFGFPPRDISNNNIIGSIPSSLGDLEHLLKLWVLWRVVLWNLDRFVLLIDNIHFVRNLSKNHLTGFIPAEFGNLRSVMEM